MSDACNQPQVLSSLPDFDDKLVSHSTPVADADAELTKYIDNSNQISQVAIKELLIKVQKAQQDFNKLAGRINTQYKVAKQNLVVSRKNEAEAKHKEKHTIEKAKEYREKVRIFEQKAASAGTSKEDLARWYAQDRKRKHID